MTFPEIIADESVDGRIISALEKSGFTIYSVSVNNKGIIDEDVIKIALNRKAFILTEDKDFGDEIIFKKSPHYGTLLLRLHGLHISEKISLVLETLNKYKEELLHSFSVLTSKKLRIRNL